MPRGRILAFALGAVVLLACTQTALLLSGENPSEKPAARQDWIAAAPGIVEPASGFYHVDSPMAGRIATIPVSEGDRVATGNILATLEDAELGARVEEAQAEVAFRQSELDAAIGQDAIAERQSAAASVADAEKALAEARNRLAGAAAQSAAFEAARAEVEAAQSKLDEERRNLESVTAMTKAVPVSRQESALRIARAQLAQAQAVFERTRIRAPVDATVLRRLKQIGETVNGSPGDTMMILGDVGTLRVRAAVDERDYGLLRIGGLAAIAVEADPSHRVAGTIADIGRLAGQRTLQSGDPSARTDTHTIDVLIALDGRPALLPGMHVDVFFQAAAQVSEATNPSTSGVPKK
jgi:HlyD family secretion protein